MVLVEPQVGDGDDDDTEASRTEQVSTSSIAEASALLRRIACGKEDDDTVSDGLDRLLNLAKTAPRNAIQLYQYDSIAMSALRRPFPPSTASTGFSFFTSIKLESREHGVEVLHLFDAAQRSCDVRLSVESGTGMLSYTSGLRHPTLHFPNAQLKVGQWHHVCLIHARPKGDSRSSRVQLFLDGNLAHDYNNAAWPSAPPPASAVRTVIGSTTLETSSPSSSQEQQGQSQNKKPVWCLGTTYLLDCALPPDMPLVLAELAGTGYNGNFQDSLGRFLTYSTSAKVNLRLDALSRSQTAANDLSGHSLVQVITGTASAIFPEERFYFIINAASNDDKTARRMTKAAAMSNSASDGDLSISSSSTGQGNEDKATVPGLLFNQATALTRNAIETSYGYAKATGTPVLHTPACGLADDVWRVGGFALLLRLVEQSQSSAILTKSLQLFFHLVGSSWRLSEDVETSRGYDVLHYLMWQKRHLLDVQVLQTFADAVGLEDGHDEVKRQTAALINPFLFRVCILDFHLWTATTKSIELQMAHLDVINTFLRTSRYRRFNSKRVAKMQITRKILYHFTSAAEPDGFLSPSINAEHQAMLAVEYVTTLRSSLVATFNDAAIRNLSSYLAVQLCSPPQRSTPSTSVPVSPSLQEAADTEEGGEDRLSSQQLALMVFEMLSDLVLERPPFLRKFGSVINIRWLRIFVSLTMQPRAGRLALDIMAALVSNDARYAEHRSSGAITERRMRLWFDSLKTAETNRCMRMRMDFREASSFAERQWHAHLLPELQRERAALVATRGADRTFELDPVEGPLRMRAKMREAHEVWEGHLTDPMPSPTVAVAEASATHTVQPSEVSSLDDLEDETHSPTSEMVIVNQEADVSIDAGTTGTGSVEADTHDEKYRRIIRSLEKGDVIEGVENSLRVVFIECRASLLIFGKRCFYIIDDYFQRSDGELCNVWEAPEEERDTIVMSTLSSTNDGSHGASAAAAMTLVNQLEGDQQQTRKWKWSELQLITMKTFLHRRTAIEIAFRDGQTCLLVLATTAQASAVYHTLAARNRAAAQAFQTLCNGVRTGAEADKGATANNGPRHSGGLSRLTDAVLGRGVGTITQRWMERKISNFDYLMCLNTASGRTYQDITQYPIMPFILRNYSSQKLDLDDPATFRDLSLPMGAQKDSRRKQFQERYEQLAELYGMDEEATKPFHYGTHYSTAATVSGFLTRLRPFDKIVKALQGGSFDLPDRTFSSIGHAFASAAEGSLGDVRELIPEAFYLPEFLVNANHFDFGQTQSGVTINDVELPPWSHNDPRLFIKLHRDALESEYVSQHLHLWIDLIFGYRQRGQAAVEATNCFHELSYDDGVDLQTIESPLERQAVLKTIHMFGVCPRQLFQSAHPARQAAKPVTTTLSVPRTPWLLMQSVAPTRVLKHSAVHFIYVNGPSSSAVAKAFTSPRDYLILPHVGISLSLGHLDASIRFFARDNMNEVKGVAEQVLPDRATCFVDASPYSTTVNGGPSEAGTKQARILIGGAEGSLLACQVDGALCELSSLYACRGHTDSILSLDHCHAWSLSVSGSQDCTAIIWDNRGTYVKSLPHQLPVQCVRICRSSGLIAAASGATLSLWSINGDAIASIETGGAAMDKIASLTFYEGNAQAMSCDDEERSMCMVFTGHRGKVIGWRCVPDYDRTSRSETGWRLEPFHVSEHHDRLELTTAGLSTHPLITSLLFHGDTLLSGDGHGRLYAWCLPGQAVEVSGNSCVQCGRKSGLFEKRIYCASCGGLFCGPCLYTLAGSPFGLFKYCGYCRDHLSTLVSRSPRIT